MKKMKKGKEREVANLKAGVRVRLQGTGGILEGLEGEVVEVKTDEAHVILDPFKEAAWCGGREYWVQIEALRKTG